MTVRNGSGERGHFDLYRSSTDDGLSGGESRQDADVLSVRRPDFDFAFHVALLVELDENVVYALILRNGTDRNGQHVLLRCGEQVDLGKRTGNHVAAVIEFEDDRKECRIGIGTVPYREQPAVHFAQ